VTGESRSIIVVFLDSFDAAKRRALATLADKV